MDIQVQNLEWTKTNSRLKATMDVKVDWLTLKNCCLFVREDGTREVRPPIRQQHYPGKTIYEQLVVFNTPRRKKTFQTEVLKQIDAMSKN